jgi:predicted MPP superfamily phosphohydrolase
MATIDAAQGSEVTPRGPPSRRASPKRRRLLPALLVIELVLLAVAAATENWALGYTLPLFLAIAAFLLCATAYIWQRLVSPWLETTLSPAQAKYIELPGANCCDPLWCAPAGGCCTPCPTAATGGGGGRRQRARFWFWLLFGLALSTFLLTRTLVGVEPAAYMIIFYNVLGLWMVLLGAALLAELAGAALLLLVVAGAWVRARCGHAAAAGGSASLGAAAAAWGAPHREGWLRAALQLSLFPDREAALPRRRTLARARSLAIVGAFVGLGANSVAVAYRAPTAVEVLLPLPGLPACMDGFSAVLMSDVHIGPMLGRAELRRQVQQVNALAPDAVFLVGDMTEGRVDQLGEAALELQGLAASSKLFVTGNHEGIHGDAQKWNAWMSDHGITALDNRRVRLAAANANANASCAGIEVAGVADWTLDYDLNAAMGGAGAGAAAAAAARNTSLVLLAHQPQPETIQRATAVHGADLILSGHVHGGQLWPTHGMTLLVFRHFSGLYEYATAAAAGSGGGGGGVARSLVYVSEGTVGWGPRVRFGSRNELTRLVLYSPPTFAALRAAGRVPSVAAQARMRPSERMAWLSVATIALCALAVCVRAVAGRSGDAGGRPSSWLAKAEDFILFFHEIPTPPGRVNASSRSLPTAATASPQQLQHQQRQQQLPPPPSVLVEAPAAEAGPSVTM